MCHAFYILFVLFYESGGEEGADVRVFFLFVTVINNIYPDYYYKTFHFYSPFLLGLVL